MELHYAPRMCLVSTFLCTDCADGSAGAGSLSEECEEHSKQIQRKIPGQVSSSA